MRHDSIFRPYYGISIRRLADLLNMQLTDDKLFDRVGEES